MTNTQKTHWLQNPNKNYLGHQDLPNGENQTLTLESGKWEAVTNPKLNTITEKRVLRFKEKDKWIKPFICNETNAFDICKFLQIEYIEDCIGAKITFTIKKVKVGKITTNALRILDAKKGIVEKINEEKLKILLDLINQQKETTPQKICDAFKIRSLADLPQEKFELVKKGIEKYIDNENI